MRKFKFRGNTPDGKFVYGDLIHDDKGLLILSEGQMHRVEEVALFVGVDKKGREVYEGDVVFGDSGHTFVVELEPHGCAFQSVNGRRNYSSLTFQMFGRNDLSQFSLDS